MNSLGDDAITKNLTLTGKLTTPAGSGTIGQILISTGTGISWVNNTGAMDTLQTVTNNGSTTTNTITVGGIITPQVSIPTITFGSYASPIPSSLQFYVPGVQRYIFWIEVPNGSVTFDCGLTIGIFDALSTNISTK